MVSRNVAELATVTGRALADALRTAMPEQHRQRLPVLTRISVYEDPRELERFVIELRFRDVTDSLSFEVDLPYRLVQDLVGTIRRRMPEQLSMILPDLYFGLGGDSHLEGQTPYYIPYRDPEPMRVRPEQMNGEMVSLQLTRTFSVEGRGYRGGEPINDLVRITEPMSHAFGPTVGRRVPRDLDLERAIETTTRDMDRARAIYDTDGYRRLREQRRSLEERRERQRNPYQPRTVATHVAAAHYPIANERERAAVWQADMMRQLQFTGGQHWTEAQRQQLQQLQVHADVVTGIAGMQVAGAPPPPRPTTMTMHNYNAALQIMQQIRQNETPAARALREQREQTGRDLVAQQNKAKAVAHRLLQDNLDAQQLQDLEFYNEFSVVSPSGAIYTLFPYASHNVLVRRPRTVRGRMHLRQKTPEGCYSMCFLANRSLPDGDARLMQKLAIELREEDVWKTANTTSMNVDEYKRRRESKRQWAMSSMETRYPDGHLGI